MSVNKSNWECSLKDIEEELSLLLSTVKPEDKLKVNDVLVLSNDFNIPFYWKIDKWTSIEIVSMKKWKDETKTTLINYKILWWKDDILTMSKWIFIASFCDDIRTKQKHFNDKLKKLREEEKKFKKNMKESHSECSTEEVKENINFIISLTKAVKNKLWYKK